MKHILVAVLFAACASTAIDASFITKLKKNEKELVQHKESICKGETKGVAFAGCVSQDCSSITT